MKMNKNMHRVIATMLTTVMVASLSGCRYGS